MYCKLTDNNLPVVRVLSQARWNKEFVGNQRVSAMPPAFQIEKGYVPFTEEIVSSDYDKGAPVDVLANDAVTRTYPAKALKDDDWLKEKRWVELEALSIEREAAGVLVGGDRIPTNPQYRIKLDQAERAAQRPGRPPPATGLELARGVWKSVNPAELRTIYEAVEDHLDAVSNAKRVHSVAIDLLTGQAILDYDITTGWN